MAYWYAPATGDELPASVLWLEAADRPDAATAPAGTVADLIGPPAGMVHEVPGPFRLPAAGDVVAPSFDPMRDPVRVVEGSELLTAPVPATGGTGGWLAVVHVTGEPRTVVAAYVAQADSADEVAVDELEVGGRPVLRATHDNAGGTTFSVTATTDDAGEWYAMLDVSND